MLPRVLDSLSINLSSIAFGETDNDGKQGVSIDPFKPQPPVVHASHTSLVVHASHPSKVTMSLPP